MSNSKIIIMIGMIMNYAKGNPVAMTFLMELFSPENLKYSIPIAIKLEQVPSLKGTNLYVLWSDLCNKNMELVSKLCENCPNDILDDACSRQDYSGRDLVKDYFKD
jgi:hypothetical protein